MPDKWIGEDSVMEEKEFDYAVAVAELEMLVAKVEDPETGIEDIGGCVSRAEELVTRCRTYLRQAREKVDKLEVQ